MSFVKCMAHCNANQRGQGANKTPVNCVQLSADCRFKMSFLSCGVQMEGPRTRSFKT